jgi:hypothetical protein
MFFVSPKRPFRLISFIFNKDDYTFSLDKNELTINADALKFWPTKNNIFVVKTKSLYGTYYQVLNIKICSNIFTPTHMSNFLANLLCQNLLGH